MAILSIADLYFQYNNKNLFKNLYFDVYEGNKIGLLGSNGSGKTTLFLLICGLLAINKGDIFLFNKRIEKGMFYPEIGLIFQNPDDQLFCLQVRDDIIFGAENLSLSLEEIEERLKDVLSATGVEHLLNRFSHELSGGEKCMVAIASVLIMEPKLILYDEPSANLDLRARRRLINFLKSSEQTMIIASHDLELIREVCDRTIVLNQGKIVADGDPITIMGDRALMEENCLEVPVSLRANL
ncbi:energy-coupling factor ABC transporter ATP-binding protein [Cyanobacterium sp. IPPAS B-1200]|uniref:energy-coupling factor ABC transporter ATP-binding protein n=1 Tax=Cyanobacterium sp. IPPAS B-1200 TaxID=1562720 RepID=UPI00085262AC|nr:ABC transporter ATP-binding protein [Cyanobacterium sp. IPPAS B-1200]OEJ78199.1 ABC transporter ATP-binding protein [Cyanobacterium sp. IPPAS B-1200]